MGITKLDQVYSELRGGIYINPKGNHKGNATKKRKEKDGIYINPKGNNNL
jgi:hypothetical protein